MRAATVHGNVQAACDRADCRSDARPARFDPESEELRHLRLRSAHDRAHVDHAARAGQRDGPRIRRRSRGGRQCGERHCGKAAIASRAFPSSAAAMQARAGIRASAGDMCTKGMPSDWAHSHGAYADYVRIGASGALPLAGQRLVPRRRDGRAAGGRLARRRHGEDGARRNRAGDRRGTGRTCRDAVGEVPRRAPCDRQRAGGDAQTDGREIRRHRCHRSGAAARAAGREDRGQRRRT